MRIVTWNVASLNGLASAAERFGGVARLLDALGADVLCVQETKLSHERLTRRDDAVRALAVQPGCESFWSGSRAEGVRKGHAGVATFVREAWSPVAAAEGAGLLGGDGELEREGRALLTDHGAFVVLNVYVPNAGEAPARERLPAKMRFLRALQALVRAQRAVGKAVVVCGDLNVARSGRDVYAARAREPWMGYGAEELDFMQGFVDDGAAPSSMSSSSSSAAAAAEAGGAAEGSKAAGGGPGSAAGAAAASPRLVDAWRAANPDTAGAFSVWDWRTRARETNQGARIDFILPDREFFDRFFRGEVTAPAATGSATG